MLPPPFLILPQAEINFNYFASLAHDECQDNEALTLNKYVALGLCLVQQRTRAACAWWGPGWRASLSASCRAGRAGSTAGNGSGDIHGTTFGSSPVWAWSWSWEVQREGVTAESRVMAGLVPRAAWKGSWCFQEHILTLFAMAQLQKHQNLLSRLALTILVHTVPKKKLEIKKTPTCW